MKAAELKSNPYTYTLQIKTINYTPSQSFEVIKDN